MNPLTLMLAGIIGPTLALLGIGMLCNPHYYVEVMKRATKPSMGTLLSSMSMIAIGIAMMQSHMLWSTLPEILVSIIGIAFLVKGIGFALLPRVFDSVIEGLISKNWIILGALIWIIGGGYLTWVAYM